MSLKFIVIVFLTTTAGCSLSQRTSAPAEDVASSTATPTATPESLTVSEQPLPSGLYEAGGTHCSYRIASSHNQSGDLDWFLIQFQQPCSFQGNYRMNCGQTEQVTAPVQVLATCKPESNFPALDIQIDVTSSRSFVERDLRTQESVTYQFKSATLSRR